MPQFQPSVPKWLTIRELAERLNTTEDYIKRMLNPNLPRRNCPRYIHSDDILALDGKKVRYLESNGQLVYPRFINKKH